MARKITITLVVVVFSGLVYFLGRYQDADLTLHFYEHFGASPDTVLRGKVVWIVGASSGIGEHLAYEFAKHGSKLVLSARRVEELQRVKRNCLDLVSEHQRIESILVQPLDLMKYETHKNATDTVVRHFGQIDILVLNAAAVAFGWVKDIPLKQELTVMNTNIAGSVSLTKTVLPHLMSRRQGHIAVTSSIAGKIASPGSAAYSASKFGLQGYFDALRLELMFYNITVSVHVIGFVDTSVWPDKTSGQRKRLSEVTSAPEVTSLLMAESRCAQLMVTAIINNIDEPWISRHPPLLLGSLNQYFPGFFRWLSKNILIKETMKFYATILGMSPP